MQLKKIALVFLVVVMMFSLAAIGIAADGADSELAVSAKVESDSALSNDPLAVKPGDVIKFVVSIDSTPGAISDFAVIVAYDDVALDFIKHTDGDVFAKDKAPNVSNYIDNIKYGTAVTYWIQPSVASANCGAVFTLEFKVSESFRGDISHLAVVYYGAKIGDDNIQVNAGDSRLPVVSPIKVHNYGAPEYIDGNCVNDSINRYTCTDAGCGDVLDVVAKPKGHTVGELIAAVAPTTEKTGLRAHYQCTACSKYLDTDMWTEINPVVTKLPKMIKTPADSVWTKGDAAPEYVSDGSFDSFKSVKVDGKVVPTGAFVAKADENGNTVITLEPVYLKDLAAGDHKVSIVFADDSWDKDYACDADFSVRSNGAIVTIIIIVAAILVLAAGVIAALKVLKKKNII